MDGGKYVHKKTSPDGKITLILEKREYLEWVSHVEPISGVLLINGDDLEPKQKVYGQLLVTYRYGRVKDTVMGLKFNKELVLDCGLLYPSNLIAPDEPTKIQKKLLAKFGSKARAFELTIPTQAPNSIIFPDFREMDDENSAGIFYTVRIFSSSSADYQAHRTNTVEMAIRKVRHVVPIEGAPPSVLVRRHFMFTPGEVELYASLDRCIYQSGDNIRMTTTIQNHSRKTVHRIEVSLIQLVKINLFKMGTKEITLNQVCSKDGFPIVPGCALTKTILLLLQPEHMMMMDNQRAIAMERPIMSQFLNEESEWSYVPRAILASSTPPGEVHSKDAFGIQVSYRIDIKLSMGPVSSKLKANIPFLILPARSPLFLKLNDDEDGSSTGLTPQKRSNHSSADCMAKIAWQMIH